MKKFWNLLLMTFAVVGVVACTEQNPVDEPQAESKLTLVSEASLEFAAEGGEGTIGLYSISYCNYTDKFITL